MSAHNNIGNYGFPPPKNPEKKSFAQRLKLFLEIVVALPIALGYSLKLLLFIIFQVFPEDSAAFKYADQARRSWKILKAQDFERDRDTLPSGDHEHSNGLSVPDDTDIGEERFKSELEGSIETKDVDDFLTYYYTVRYADNLGHIAVVHKTTVRRIVKDNLKKIKNKNHITPGTKLKVPAWKIHVVQKGEYLTKICNRYKVRLESLKAANGLKTNAIEIGQALIIPYREDNFRDYVNNDPRVKGSRKLR